MRRHISDKLISIESGGGTCRHTTILRNHHIDADVSVVAQVATQRVLESRTAVITEEFSVS